MSSENNNLDNNYARTPPELNFPLLTLEDIGSKPHKWLSKEIKSQLPTDILLMTANDDEFTACYSYMKDVQRGYCVKLGIVDFGRFVGENNLEVKVALMKHEQGSSATQTAVTDAAGVLCPKVTLLVGICDTMEPAKVKLGDVVISAKLATYDDKKIMENGMVEYRGPKPEVSPNMAKLILHAADGWKPPLKDPNSFKVKVQTALMLSGSDSIKNRERLEELRTYFHDALVIEIGGRGR